MAQPEKRLKELESISRLLDLDQKDRDALFRDLNQTADDFLQKLDETPSYSSKKPPTIFSGLREKKGNSKKLKRFSPMNLWPKASMRHQVVIWVISPVEASILQQLETIWQR
ncbi:MAG: hypothetical protein R3277_02945 [Brumimicrobium sp.]|nr:hypothetical protein [Brumimicrobium sp.]